MPATRGRVRASPPVHITGERWRSSRRRPTSSQHSSLNMAAPRSAETQTRANASCTSGCSISVPLAQAAPPRPGHHNDRNTFPGWNHNRHDTWHQHATRLAAFVAEQGSRNNAPPTPKRSDPGTGYAANETPEAPEPDRGLPNGKSTSTGASQDGPTRQRSAPIGTAARPLSGSRWGSGGVLIAEDGGVDAPGLDQRPGSRSCFAFSDAS